MQRYENILIEKEPDLNLLKESIDKGYNFIAYSVDLLPGEIPKPASEVTDAKFVCQSDFDSILWVSEAMKSIATNAIEQTPFSTTDYTKQRGSPYLLHQNTEVDL